MDKVDFAEGRGKILVINEWPISFYQENCRIYLDEYEVEEWDYLPLFDNTVLMNRFMRKD